MFFLLPSLLFHYFFIDLRDALFNVSHERMLVKTTIFLMFFDHALQQFMSEKEIVSHHKHKLLSSFRIALSVL